MKKQLVSFLTVSTTSLIFFFIALFIGSQFPDKFQLNSQELLLIYAVPTDYFAPEPQERWIFIINTLLSPLLCGGFYLLFTRLAKKEKIAKLKILHWVISPIFLVLLSCLAAVGLQFAVFKYVRASDFVRHPWITSMISLSIAVILLKYDNTQTKKYNQIKHLGNFFYWGMGCLLLLLMGLETVFNDYEPYIPHIHFIAYFDSVVQVFLGKHVFVDVYPQYGAYAWLLKPIFQVIDLSVLNFTIIMGILKIAIYGSFLVLFNKLLDNKVIAFLSFTTLFFYTRMRPPIELLQPPDYQYNPQTINYPGLLDPYFQYNPHRMIFPVLLVLLTWLFITSKNARIRKILYFINSFLSALATLWNPETGLVVTLAWLGFLVYQEMADIKINRFTQIFFLLIKHVCVLMFAHLIIFGCFSISTYLETGIFPNFITSPDYINLFYFYGYFMIPMPILHPWNMVALVYLSGMYFSVRELITTHQSDTQINESNLKNHYTNRFIFIVTITGIGLFNYYVGRSHDYNLIATTWPAYILLAIFVERLYKRITPIFRSNLFNWKVKALIASKNSFQVGLFLVLFFFLGSSLISIFGNLPAYLTLINQRISTIKQEMPPDLASEVRFITATSSNDDPVFIISDYAPELYLYTNHSQPLNIAGFGEIILQSDVEIINQYLADPPPNAKIYWDQRFYDINHYNYDINPYNFPTLVSRELSPNKNIVLFSARK